MTGPATVALDSSSLASLYTHPVALLHTHSKDDRPETIQAVAAKFLDSIPFYTTSDPKVNTALKLPPGRHTVLIKGDLQQVYPGADNDEQGYIDWVRDNKYPLVTRIDSSNAKDILKGDRWVVLMVVGNDLAYDPFHAMARLTPGVLFAELNGQAWQSYVKRVYGITTFPTLILVDPKTKRYFDQDLEEMPFTTDRPDAVFAALQQPDALTGYTTEPSRSLSTVQKMVTFVGDHVLVFGIGLLGLLAVVVTLAISTDQQDDDDAKKKKE
ncbi:hypothetical protein [Absidia glauca]|uniref:Thioredoxin domain-containing protein n=1 Tax=Absidia glauca TaxID=4829 RepID=A0A168T348_ABSGL|nr:hypothetical protein [Absidia glauca]